MGTSFENGHLDFKEMYKESYSKRIDLNVSLIDDINNYLSLLEERLFESGLYESDISEIKDAIKKLYTIDFSIRREIERHIANYKKDERFDELIKYQKYLLRVIGDIGIRLIRILKDLKISVGKYNIKDFIKDNSSLLHLVSTNNHSNQRIRKVSDDSYFYLCHFHDEKRSSMKVNNHKNRLYCYGCGTDLDVFNYLRYIENISYNDALLLLAEINKIKVYDNKFSASDELVKKYTNGSSLRRYEMRVISGRKRASYKNKTLNNILAMEKFDQEFETIRRIRNDEYISFTSGSKGKVLKYEEY